MLKNRHEKVQPPVTFRVALGRIRPGTFPEALDYFEVTGWGATKTYEFTADTEVMQALGGKPTRIPIRLASDDIDDSLEQSYLLKSKDDGRVLCEGDGETARRGTARVEIPCRYARTFPQRTPRDLLAVLNDPASDDLSLGFMCPFAQNRDGEKGPGLCKPESKVFFFLDLPTIARTHGAMASFHSKGERTADALYGSLVTIRDRVQSVLGIPVLRGLPLDLVMAMRWMQHRDPRTGKSAKTRKPVVWFEPRLTDAQLIEAATAEYQSRGRIAALVSEQRKMLAAARTIDNEQLERGYGVIQVKGTTED